MPGWHGVLTDYPCHTFQARLLLQQLQEPTPQFFPSNAPAVVPPTRHGTGIDAVGLQRVDSREETCLGTLGIQRPQTADVTARVTGDRL